MKKIILAGAVPALWAASALAWDYVPMPAASPDQPAQQAVQAQPIGYLPQCNPDDGLRTLPDRHFWSPKDAAAYRLADAYACELDAGSTDRVRAQLAAGQQSDPDMTRRIEGFLQQYGYEVPTAAMTASTSQ